MRSYEQIDADAQPQPPFSNGTQGYGWMDNWCFRCKNDSDELVDRGEGCPLILVALNGKTPAEWITNTERDAIFSNYTCIEFRPDDDGGDGDPPDEPMPGQGALFDEDDYTGTFMWRDVVDEIRPNVHVPAELYGQPVETVHPIGGLL